VLSLWDDVKDDARNIAWTRDFYRAMQPWSAALVYVNTLADDDGARVRQAFGDNYDRLAKVKTKYDPANRFRRNQNIPPVNK
jgi:FAD/FMN-containing dehydrogenase